MPDQGLAMAIADQSLSENWKRSFRHWHIGNSPWLASGLRQMGSTYEGKGRGRAREDRVMSVGEDNVLLSNGEPLVYDEREHTAALTTPDGIEVPLHLDDNGNVILPTPSQIEEMKANGEGEWVELPETSAPPPFPEEEWKQQEALRQLEEAARQQQ